MKIKENKERGITTEFLGTRKMKDLETGEVVELQYARKKVRHGLKRGWRRVYLENFMELLTGLYSQGKKVDVIEFILDNLNSENQFTMTQSQVIEKLNYSPKTVVDTYKYLIESNFMKKVGSVFIVNPKYVCAFGSDKRNAIIAIKYESDDPSLFDEKE